VPSGMKKKKKSKPEGGKVTFPKPRKSIFSGGGKKTTTMWPGRKRKGFTLKKRKADLHRAKTKEGKGGS